MSAAAAPPADEYRIQVEDVIAVDVFSTTSEEFNFLVRQAGNNRFRVDTDGNVNLPVIGDLMLVGLTLQAAEDTLTRRFEPYLSAPLVRLQLVTPFVFTLLGEVRSPGRYQLEGERLSLLEALANGGDMTTFADRSAVRIVRRDEYGVRRIEEVNVLDRSLLTHENYMLRSGDVVIVDPLRAQTFRTNQLGTFSIVTGVLTTIVSLTFILVNLNRL